MSKKSVDKKMIADMIAILKGLPNGTFITSWQVMEKAGYDYVDDLSYMIDMHNALFDAAEEEGICLDMSKHDNKFEGLPFNLDFEVKHLKSDSNVKIEYITKESTKISTLADDDNLTIETVKELKKYKIDCNNEVLKKAIDDLEKIKSTLQGLLDKNEDFLDDLDYIDDFEFGFYFEEFEDVISNLENAISDVDDVISDIDLATLE
jgi:methyl-accepting chemotaxis protein